MYIIYIKYTIYKNIICSVWQCTKKQIKYLYENIKYSKYIKSIRNII